MKTAFSSFAREESLPQKHGEPLEMYTKHAPQRQTNRPKISVSIPSIDPTPSRSANASDLKVPNSLLYKFVS